MIGYMSELSNNIIKDLKNYRIFMTDSSLWIANYIKILKYSKECISLRVKDNIIHIEGVGMEIKMLEKKELLLDGKINNVYLEKPHKENKNEKNR